MKRKKLLFLLLAGCLFLTACSENNHSVKSAVESEHTDEEEQTLADAENENPTDNSDTAEESSALDAQKENDTDTAPEEDHPFEVSVEIKDDYSEKLADNGDSLIYVNYQTPVLTMDQYKQSEKLINDFFQKCSEEIVQSGEEYYKQALDEYNDLSEEEKETFSSYGVYRSYDKKRLDEKVLSFAEYSSFYTGGAHGIYEYSGYNFDPKTGKKLTLSDIFKDKEAAVSEIRQSILKLCKNVYYNVRLFDDYEDNIDSVISDDCWFLDNDGIHFISNPYLLGSYAAGDFEFIIPYSDLNELKEEYSYDGSEMYPFLINDTIQKDLDGDGTQESITMSVDNDILENIYSGNWDIVEEPKLHLSIGETDFTDVISQSVDYLTNNFNPYCYLVDLDTSKPGLEIMFTDIYDNDYCSTYFYEYKDGKVSYLGNIPDRLGYDSFHIDGDGTVHSRLRIDLLQTAFSHVVYKLENGKLTMETRDWYEVDDSTWNDDYKNHSILQDVTVYTEPDLSSETKVLMPDDGKVSFPATDNEHWYQLKTEDGKTYYLYMKDSITIPVNGEDFYATDIFDNLLLAG